MTESHPHGVDILALLITGSLLLAGCGDPASRPAAKVKPQLFTTPLGVEMLIIPGGNFIMGDDQGDADQKPARQVAVHSFAMDKYEVTQKSFHAIMGRNPSAEKFKDPDAPVQQVHWFDAITYCNMRSKKEGLRPCYDLQKQTCDFEADGYRLPTEAEWEYACRAGTTGAYSFGGNKGRLPEFAWFKGNAKGPQSVGRKPANPWGLHDMHGNVLEWCHDFYAPDYYAGRPESNPTGPESGDKKVLRGGGWTSTEENCRSVARSKETPRFADACLGADTYGFRCVRKPPAAP